VLTPHDVADRAALEPDNEQPAVWVATFLSELGCRPMPDTASGGQNYDTLQRHAHAKAGRPETTAADRAALNARRESYVETAVRWYAAAPADARREGDEIATLFQRLRTDPHYRRRYWQNVSNSRRKWLLSNTPQQRRSRLCCGGRATRPRGARRPRARRRAGSSSRTASADPGEPEPAGDHPALAGWRTTTAGRPA